MKWWCSASDAAWSWSWRPYPGVWIVVALAIVLHLRAWSRVERAGVARRRAGQTIAFLAGTLALWLATDWPVGALGAGYLLSAHTVAYILLALVAPPLLWLGLPRVQLAPGDDTNLGRGARLLARPLPALVIFNATLVLTHLPDFVDGWMRSQWGSFGTDIAWLASGLILWWPVMAPNPEVSRLSKGAQMGYLFAASILPTVPAMFLVFASYPVYGLYELAPRVTPLLPAGTDQQLAGLIMKVIGDIPLWIGFAAVFFTWARRESREEAGALV
jgi:cytochrome c oxidase assembly factor CtaG